MTMGQRHKHADVIIAWAEGADVQVWYEGAKCWYDVVKIIPFFMGDKCRIKPSPKKYRVALLRNRDEEPRALAANSQETADNLETMPYFVRWLTDWIDYEE